VKHILLIAPAIVLSVPKLVTLLVTPAMVPVVCVMSPVPTTVPVGRT